MTTRRTLLAAWTLLSFLPALHADEFSNNLAANLNGSAMDALSEDVGAVVGAGSFHSGETLNFPLGFDIGFHAAGVNVSDDNKILKDDDSLAVAGFVQAEVGLPLKLNVIGRYGKLYDADVYGGGLRWGIIDSSTIGMPSIAISALYNKIGHQVIDGSVINANLALSFDVPIIHPYIGVGYDWTKLEVKSLPVEGDATGYRVEAGINLSIIPFTYITLGGGLANGQKMGHAGFGVRF